MQRTEIHHADSPGFVPDGGVVGGEEPLSTDAVFETLSSQRRRYTLHYLKQRDGPVTIRALSEQLAAWENGTDLADVTPKERKRVYTALHQTHLPKMDSLGVVTYDRDRGTIELRNHVRAFDVYLDVVPVDDLPWGQFYLALGAVFAAIVTVGSLGVYPFSLVPGYGYALVVALTFAAAAGYHTYRERETRVGGTDEPTDVTMPPEASEPERSTASADD
ncbi:DUF7344 domain-containing protein [Halorarius litoreus]|uniref:DUF7344 domain-containing protein n=1 Tax=Halorarius litoreus TaxID=2962676 RepID=UPI0020CC35C7|nr:hypothetical protein [Halorarius litoreus]